MGKAGNRWGGGGGGDRRKEREGETQSGPRRGVLSRPLHPPGTPHWSCGLAPAQPWPLQPEQSGLAGDDLTPALCL